MRKVSGSEKRAKRENGAREEEKRQNDSAQ